MTAETWAFIDEYGNPNLEIDTLDLSETIAADVLMPGVRFNTVEADWGRRSRVSRIARGLRGPMALASPTLSWS
jgi:hypothetical protein